MSINSLAKTLGIDPSNFAKYAKRGCPTSSLESARSWLAANVRSYKKEREPKVIPKINTQEITKHTTVVAEIPVISDALISEDPISGISRDDLFKMRAEMRQARNNANEMIKQTNSEGMFDDSRKFSDLLMKIINRQLAVEREIRRLNEEDEITISYQGAKEMLLEIILQTKSICNAMPANLASRVNPDNPELARMMLTDWRDTFYKTLQESKYKEQNEQTQQQISATSQNSNATTAGYSTSPEG